MTDSASLAGYSIDPGAAALILRTFQPDGSRLLRRASQGLAVNQAGSDDVRAIRAAAKHQAFDAPEGMVRIDPDTQHTSKIFRIGRITPEGRFEVVYSSEVPIAPIPYPNTRSKGDWDAFLMDLHLR